MMRTQAGVPLVKAPPVASTAELPTAVR